MARIIYVLIILLWSPLAFSCEEYFGIGNNQVKETQEQVINADPLDFDAVLAFERLMCADRGVVRSFALEIGLSSSNTTIRSRALLSALMEKETITLEPYFEEGISKSEKEFVQKNSMLPFGVVFRLAEQSCLSIHYKDRCDPDHSVSVEGDEVTLRFSSKTARLSLDDKGRLRGIYSEKGTDNTRVPVQLKLR